MIRGLNSYRAVDEDDDEDGEDADAPVHQRCVTSRPRRPSRTPVVKPRNKWVLAVGFNMQNGHRNAIKMQSKRERERERVEGEERSREEQCVYKEARKSYVCSFLSIFFPPLSLSLSLSRLSSVSLPK